MEFQNKGYRQLGNLYPDRLSISLEGSPVAAVVFALWYRAFVPAECNLFLYDQGFNDHVELTASSTETQLLAALKIV